MLFALYSHGTLLLPGDLILWAVETVYVPTASAMLHLGHHLFFFLPHNTKQEHCQNKNDIQECKNNHKNEPKSKRYLRNNAFEFI